jgi:exopolysaccharide biosynthesis protein
MRGASAQTSRHHSLITIQSERKMWSTSLSRFFSRPLLLLAPGLALAALSGAPAGAQDTPPSVTLDNQPLYDSSGELMAPAPTPDPSAPEQAEPEQAPTAQAYVACKPARRISYGHTMVPLSFLTQALGTSVGKVSNFYRVSYFGRTIDLYPYQLGARLDGAQSQLPVVPQNFGGVLYVPWRAVADHFGIKWQIAEDAPAHTTFFLQYRAAFVEEVRSTVMRDKVRIVLTLSNPTRITATQGRRDSKWQLAAARREGVASIEKINDYLVSRGVLTSGNWRASFGMRTNYAAPVQWFTLGYPSRLVIDVQRLFEEKSSQPIGGGLSLTKIRRGVSDGPVQMYLVRVDPREGWRVKIGSAGYSVMQRTRPSRIASRHKALVAVNGGFFAYDGAAVGAVLADGEWIRLPWKGRTGVGFRPDGSARVGNLQALAKVHFGNGTTVAVRDLNGWPDKGKITALTRRFGTYYRLRAGEIALEVENGVVTSKPGSGGVEIPPSGFALIASGGATPVLQRVARGTSARMKIEAPGWQGFSTALGGGPRLLNKGRVDVTALREDFRTDVRVGRGPRTAFGLDKYGRYLILVADGRQAYHSVGLTLHELAATMKKFGAVDAMNLDGGGSTAMAVRSRIVNRPSDGRERAVSNALLVMR